MNLSLWVTFSGDHSAAKLGAYFVTSLPFDVAHVVGNVLFCLAVRARARARAEPLPAALRGDLAAGARARRLDDRRARDPRRRAAAGRGRHAAHVAPQRPERRRRLRRRRRPALGRALHRLGGARARRRRAQPARRQHGGSDVVAWVRAHPSDVSDLGEVERTILVLRAAGLPAEARLARPRQGAARQAARERLVRRPRQHDRRSRSSPCARPAGTARRSAPPRAGSRARPTATAASTSPSRAPPRGSTTPAPRCRRSSPPAAARTPTVRRAARFLARRQNPDGGFPLQPGGPSNAQSTAWAVQGLVADGPRPRPPAAQRGEVADRLPALARDRQRQGPLLAHQRPDAGLGHRPGARRARPQAVPARPGAAGEEGRAAPRPRRRPRRPRPAPRQRRPSRAPAPRRPRAVRHVSGPVGLGPPTPPG